MHRWTPQETILNAILLVEAQDDLVAIVDKLVDRGGRADGDRALHPAVLIVVLVLNRLLQHARTIEDSTFTKRLRWSKW